MQVETLLYEPTSDYWKASADNMCTLYINSERERVDWMEKVEKLTAKNKSYREELNTANANIAYLKEALAQSKQVSIKRERQEDKPIYANKRDIYRTDVKNENLTSLEKLAFQLVVKNKGNMVTCEDKNVQLHYNRMMKIYNKKMCIYVTRTSGCRNGDKCIYAHSESELIQ